MAEEIYELQIKVRVDPETKKIEILNTALGKTTEQLKKVEKTTEETKKVNEKFRGNVSQLGSALGINITQFATLAGVIAAVRGVVVEGLKQWEQQIALNRQLETAIRGLGLSYEKLKDDIDSQLASLVENTRFTRDEATAALTQAIKYTGDYKSGLKLLQIAMNVAVGTGKSLEETLSALGMALRGGERATYILYHEFGKLGVQGKNVSEMILNLGRVFEGTAKKEESFTKQLAKTRELYQESTELLGKALMPLIVEAARGFREYLLPVLIKVGTALVDFWDKIIGYAATLIGFFTDGAKGAKAVLDEVAESSRKRWEEVNKLLAEYSGKTQKKIQDDIAKTKDFHFKTLKDIFEAENTVAKQREDIEKHFQEVIRKEQEKTHEGRLKLLEEEIEAAKKAGVDRTLIDQYYAIRKKEIEEQLKEELAKIEEEKRKKAEEELKKIEEQYKIQRELITKISDDIAEVFRQSMIEMIDGSKTVNEAVGEMWENIKKAAINAITTIVAEYITKMAVVYGLGALMGVPPPALATILGGGRSIGGAIGIPTMQEGGEVRKEGVYYLHAGEKVIPARKSLEPQFNIVLNIQPFDIRSVDRIWTERLVSRLKPILKRELQR
jgi:PAS domain-containing protein